MDGAALRAVLAPLDMQHIGDPEPIGDEFGFASSRARVAVVGPDGTERPAVVKAWSVEGHGTAEIDFYEKWAPILPVRLATCFGSHAGGEIAVLVLEDLGDVRQGDAAETMELADAVAITRDLAAIHRATVGRDSDLPAAGQPRPDEWHESRRTAHLERHGPPRHPTLRVIVNHSAQAEASAARVLAGSALGLVHGDVHSDNVVFLRNGTPVLLDWSRPQWGPAAHDVASLLLACPKDGYARVVDTYHSIALITNAEIHAAMLRRLVTATLGTAMWMPETDRQQRLVEVGQDQARTAAAWLAEVAPGLIEGLV
jgi:fructosamine-3-kinase